ncbi:hypothetical protein ACWFNE_05150 [Cellulomonas sp. NPDC055163]
MRRRHEGRERGSPGARLVGLVGGVALACTALLAGCAGAGEPLPAEAETAPRADCLAPQVIASLGLRADDASGTAHPDVPEPGAVPEAFTPVSAVQCVSGERLTDADGVWAAVTVRQLEGDLAPLLDALEEPSEPVRSDQACAAPASPAWDLWLVDALGRAVRADRPVDSCGAPTEELTAAVEQLDTTGEEHFPVDLLAARVTAPPTP